MKCEYIKENAGYALRVCNPMYCKTQFKLKGFRALNMNLFTVPIHMDNTNTQHVESFHNSSLIVIKCPNVLVEFNFSRWVHTFLNLNPESSKHLISRLDQLLCQSPLTSIHLESHCRSAHFSKSKAYAKNGPNSIAYIERGGLSGALRDQDCFQVSKSYWVISVCVTSELEIACELISSVTSLVKYQSLVKY